MSHNERLWPSKDTLAVPGHQVTSSMTMWTDYAIWGLDIYDNQPTWYSIIELIIVLTDRRTKGLPLLSDLPVDGAGNFCHEDIKYDIYFNDNLRHLMFRDQDILPLADKNSTDDNALWAEWFAKVKQEFPNLDLTYLKSAFNNDFASFAEAVDLLRSAEVEAMYDKRWTSRHLLPVGRSVLFPDYAQKKNGADSLDRRFFRRTGEIFYLMLSRSSDHLKSSLSPLLEERIFTNTTPWNSIAQKLQGPDKNLSNARKITSESFAYLPCPKMKRYDVLAEDWINILKHANIPFEDMLDYLMRITGLNEALYIIDRATASCGMTKPPVFYLDMMGNGKTNHVRSASVENYKSHKNLTRKAIESYIQSYLDTDEWKNLGVGSVHDGEAHRLIGDRFLFKTSYTTGHPVSKETQAQELFAAAATRSHTIGSAFTAHSRQIGFLAMKGGIGGWYSPTDAFLESLVISNVDGTMEFSEFLSRLYNRYGFVIGAEEAKKANNVLVAPGESFVANERRFEERLLVLGFINRKSDQCAFVINPFSKGDDE